MCTIIKVKRKINEDPAECLIVESKKKKTSGEAEGEEFKQILKYAGSARNENEIPAKILELNSKTNESGVIRTRARGKSVSKQSYVVVDKKRGLENDELMEVQVAENKRSRAANGDLENVNIIDVMISSEYFAQEDDKNVIDTTTPSENKEKITINGVEMIREKKKESENYIYDLYYVKSDNLAGHLDLLYPNSYEIRAYSYYKDAELINDNEDDEPDGYDDDEEDSNDEANWRNDYPDEDEYDIDDEEDYEPGYNKQRSSHRNDYNDLDDEEYDEYSYGYDEDDQSGKHLASYMKKSLKLDRDDDDQENEDFDEYSTELNTQDLTKAYRKYKMRVLRELREQENSDSDDDD